MGMCKRATKKTPAQHKKTMQHQNNIQHWSQIVRKRIALFVLAYLLLIGLGFLLLLFAYKWATDWGLTLLTYFSEESLPALIILFLIVAYVSIIAMCLMFGLFLVKFLFTSSKANNQIKMEVKEEDCPQLFALIRETATEARCNMPHKVYLTSDINAYVNFNTNFLSMFLPIKKNLTLGVGLFAHTNTEEIKGIVAHEFGHFSQESMKVGSAVYTSNIILYNLTYGEDAWDRLLERWLKIEWMGINFFGYFTLWFINQIRFMLHRLYTYVNLAQSELSRQMEYDADAIACKIVGKEALVSGFYKMEWNINCVENTNEAISKLRAEGKMADPFEMLEQQILIDLEELGLTMKASEFVSHELCTQDKPVRRFLYEDLWESHPADSDRIAHLQDIPRPSQKTLTPAWTLLPKSLRKQIRQRIFNDTEESEANFEWLKGEELKAWLDNYNIQSWLPYHIRLFFQQYTRIHHFNPTTEECTPNTTYPFGHANRKLFYEYSFALSDLNTMESAAAGKLQLRNTIYRGKQYHISQLPIEEHKQYIEHLEQHIKEVYKQIYAYLISGERAEEIKQLYTKLFEVDQMGLKVNTELHEQMQELYNMWEQDNKDSQYLESFKEKLAHFHKQLRPITQAFVKNNSQQIENEEMKECIEMVNKEDNGTMKSHLNAFDFDNSNKAEKSQFLNDTMMRTIFVMENLSDELWIWYSQIKKEIGKIAEEMDEANTNKDKDDKLATI